jgi:hypothetical protein
MSRVMRRTRVLVSMARMPIFNVLSDSVFQLSQGVSFGNTFREHGPMNVFRAVTAGSANNHGLAVNRVEARIVGSFWQRVAPE